MSAAVQSDGVRALAPVVLGRSAVARESACTAASLVPMPRWHECTHAYISNRSCETQERRSLDTDARTRSQRVFAESTAVLVWPLIAMIARTHAAADQLEHEQRHADRRMHPARTDSLLESSGSSSLLLRYHDRGTSLTLDRSSLFAAL